MAVPDPAKPDDISKAILETIFGTDSLVLYVFVFATWALAWYTWAKSTHDRARNLYARASGIPAAMRVRAAFWALATPVVQAVYLALSYFIATHLNKAISETEGPADVDVSTWFSPPESPMQDPVFWMWFAVAVALVASGWWSALGMYGEITPFHPIAWFLFACGGVAIPILLYVNEQMGWLSLIYVGTAIFSLYMPKSCVKVWQERPA